MVSGIAVPQLVGRNAEQEILAEALASVPDLGSAVLLRGGAGIGKTALLDWAAARGELDGLRVLRVTGSETESRHAFAALHQALWPLMPFAQELTATQRAALECALGITENAPPTGFILSAAVFRLMELAGSRQPLLLVLDDLHWVDPSSAAVLAFVQLRVRQIPVAIVGAMRADGSRVDTSGAQVLDLSPLDDDKALALLDERRPDLSPEARRQVLADSSGYPLALVELPSRPRGVDGTTGALDGALADRLERAFGSQLRDLAPGARQILLVAALAGAGLRTPDLLSAASAVSSAAVTSDDLDLVAGSGLAAPDPVTGSLAFRHPLVRAALINTVGPAVLRRVHAVLARTIPSDDARHLTHLAAAAQAPDDEVAALLDAGAERTLRRGGDAEAALMLARAAELGTDPDARARRLTDAAAAAARGGRAELAEQLLHAIDRDRLSPPHQAVFIFTLSYVHEKLYADFSIPLRLYPQALQTLRALADQPAMEPVRELLQFKLIFVAVYTGTITLWEETDAELKRAYELPRLCGDLSRDPARTAHHGARRFAEFVASLTPDEEVQKAWLLLWCASAVDSFGEHEALWRRIRDRSPNFTTAYIDTLAVDDDNLRGRWDRALATAAEGVARSQEHGNLLSLRSFTVTSAYVHGGRGDTAALAAVEDALGPWRDDAPVFAANQWHTAKALCALGHGDYETAYALASSITAPGEFPCTAEQFQRVFLILVDAAMHSGRVAEARRHVAAGVAADIGTISEHHAFVLAAAAALSAEEDEVGAACEAAYAVPGSEKWPFELARVRLAHGTWLRRRQSRSEARDQLMAALIVYRGLKAEPWIRRTTEELRAAGYTLAEEPVPPAETESLTAQERRIAELAAKGLSNKQIAARLQLSPRTVGSHLYKIFPKLGVASRAALADALRRRA
ncbi:LuxR C-terminal-related transcriptional regulator [Streptomyces sp. NPDC052023]|uniref:LuxR C-terminal-related transcriptional regulator n=1 Tax=Streptomyces sp. NPDC052023 TaxID=3365681 RepID=UPI0037D24586